MSKLMKLRFLPVFLIVFFAAACATVDISEDLSPAELIQRAQEASDRNRNNAALQYYTALQQRYSDNIDLVITAEYHIAHLHYKQKRFQQAREELNAMLEYYNTPDEELLPQHFKRLALIILNNIDEIEEN